MKRIRRSTRRASRRSSSRLDHPVMTFVSNLNYVAIGVLGGVQVATGGMSLGDVQAFIQYSRSFTMPITQVASIIESHAIHDGSAERVFELLDEPEELADAKQPRVLEHATGHVTSRTYRSGTSPRHLSSTTSASTAARRGAGDRRSDGRRQDHCRQPADALLRDRRSSIKIDRHRHPRSHSRQPASNLRHGPPGHLAVRRHVAQNIAYGRENATRMRSSPQRRPLTSTISCELCRTAMTR